MRLKKELVEQLRRDIQEYYHMEDRIDEVKAKMTFNDDAEEQMKKEKNKIFFTKHLFIIFVILFSAILIGGSVGITSLVNYQHYNSEKSLNDKSLKELENYLKENLPNFTMKNYNSFILENSTMYIGVYETINSNETKYIFQCNSIYDANIKCIFINDTYTKSFNNNTISIFNDSSFPINTGDVVTGNVYINNELNRKITLNF